MLRSGTLLLIAVSVLASVPASGRPLTTEKALRGLGDAEGDDLKAALDVLKADATLLKKGRNARTLAAMADTAANPKVAGRILDVVQERGDAGCEFIAGFVDAKHPVWTDQVIERHATLPACPKRTAALYEVLRWSADPATAPEAAARVSKVLAIARAAADPTVAARVCRFVKSAPEPLRLEAIATLVAARPEGAATCIVRTWGEGGDAIPAESRKALLDALQAIGGPDLLPTFLAALDRPGDEAQACGLLLTHGAPAQTALLFALRGSEARSEGVCRCLDAAGDSVAEAVVPFVDHPSEQVRAFSLSFLTRHRSPGALAALVQRFDAGGGLAGRPDLLDVLSGYPGDQVQDVVSSALADPSATVRTRALAAVERTRAVAFVPRLVKMAEEDATPSVRARSLDALWRLGDASAVPLALRQAQYEVPPVLVSVARYLGFLGDERAVPLVAWLARSKEPEVAAAGADAFRVLTLQEPGRKGAGFRGVPGPSKRSAGRVVEFPGGRAEVLGEKGPLVAVLPGGPGMDLAWARPYLDGLGRRHVLAYVDPLRPDDAGVEGLLAPEALDGLLKTVERGKVVLVSDGIGALAALRLAMDRPDVVAGVVALACPPTGDGGQKVADDALLAALPEPFQAVAKALATDQHLIEPAALGRYLARVFAPALGGKAERPEVVLAAAWRPLAAGQAASVLSRPESRFDPKRYPGAVLVVGPLSGAGEPMGKAWAATVAAAEGRIATVDLADCGWLPSMTCTSDVIDQIKAMVAKVPVAEAR